MGETPTTENKNSKPSNGDYIDHDNVKLPEETSRDPGVDGTEDFETRLNSRDLNAGVLVDDDGYIYIFSTADRHRNYKVLASGSKIKATGIEQVGGDDKQEELDEWLEHDQTLLETTVIQTLMEDESQLMYVEGLTPNYVDIYDKHEFGRFIVRFDLVDGGESA